MLRRERPLGVESKACLARHKPFLSTLHGAALPVLAAEHAPAPVGPVADCVFLRSCIRATAAPGKASGSGTGGAGGAAKPGAPGAPAAGAAAAGSGAAAAGGGSAAAHVGPGNKRGQGLGKGMMGLAVRSTITKRGRGRPPGRPAGKGAGQAGAPDAPGTATLFAPAPKPGDAAAGELAGHAVRAWVHPAAP